MSPSRILKKHHKNHHKNQVLRLESLEVRQMLSAMPLVPDPVAEVSSVLETVEAPVVAEFAEPVALQADPVSTSSAPVVGGIAQLNDTTILLSWVEVENAESYSIFDESGTLLETVTETSCQLSDWNLALTQTLSVRANFADTTQSEAGEFTVSLNDQVVSRHVRQVPDCSPERMAKDFAYKNWHIGDKVRSTFLGWTIAEYEVVATFDYWTFEGLYAVAFKNTSSNEVVLALRGTDNITSILVDADPNGIGYSVASRHLNEIVCWAEKYVKTPGRELHLTGHSLGGALAQWITVGLTKNDIYVKEVNTFNSPGISKDYIDANYVAANCGQMIHYVQSGDIVSMAGQAFVPGTCWMYYYLDWKIISKHSTPMTVPEIEGVERPWFYTYAKISTDSLSASKFTYSQNTENPGENEYIDKVYRAQVHMLGKCLSVFKNLSARGTTEDTRREIGKFIKKYLPIFNGTEDANAADMGEISVADTRAFVDVNTKKNGKYEVYCFALTDPADPEQVLEVGSQEIEGKKTVEFDQLTPETEYVLASIRYEYDQAGEIIGVLDAQYSLFKTDAEPKVVDQDGTKIVFNLGFQDECKFQIKRSNGKTWYNIPTSENEDGNTVAALSRSRLGNRSYDYRFVNAEGDILTEGTFDFAKLAAPSFSISKIAQKPNDFTLKVKSFDSDATDHKISFRYLSDGRWSDWTDELSFSEWEQMASVTAEKDGTYTVTGLPAGCHVQVRLRSEGGYDEGTETLQVDSRTAIRGCTLARGEKLSAPVISVRADSVNSVVVKVKKLDTDAHDLTYRYRTFSDGRWSAWSDSCVAEIRNGQFRITDLPLNSRLEIHARATSDHLSIRDSVATIRFSQVKRVPRLTTPRITFDVPQDRVSILASQPATDGFLLEGRIPGSKWVAMENLLSEEALEGLTLEDFVRSFIPSEEAATFRVGSKKTLYLRLTAKSSDLDYADSRSRILTIRFPWTEELCELQIF